MSSTRLIVCVALFFVVSSPLGAGTKVAALPASNDGVAIPYGLFEPEGGGGKLPLIVDVAPSADAFELDAAKLSYYDLAKADYAVLRVPPFGRSGQQWSIFAERDVAQVIEHVCSTGRIDRDRVYLFGATQGVPANGYGAKRLQFGTLQYAYHNPDLFAAVVGSGGDLRADAYRGTWAGEWHQYQLQFEFPQRLREMPLLWAENLVNTPAWLVISDIGYVDRDQMHLYYQLDKFAPVELKLTQAPALRGKNSGGVSAIPDAILKEQIAWLLSHKREALPKRVVLTTNTLKHSESRWVRIDALSELNRFARIEAHVTDDGRVKVRGEGVEGFTLRRLDALVKAPKVAVDIEHELVEVAPVAEVSFRRVNGKWELGKAAVQGKSARCADSIIDAFREPYLLVVGTQAGAEAKLRELAAGTIAAIQNGGLAEPLDLSKVPVKTDASVTAEDMKRANLVLFGDERTNSIIAKINEKLPIRLDAGKIISGERTFSYPDQGLIMAYPNPLEPTRKVVVVTGAIWKGYLVTDKALASAPFPKNLPAHGFPLLGDWIVFRENGKAVAKIGRDLVGLDDAAVEGGWFDTSWKLVPSGPYYFFNKNFAK